MDRNELAIHDAASAAGLSVHKNVDDSWSVGSSSATELLGIDARRADTFLSDGRIRLADGRVLKRQMTVSELRVALGMVAVPEDD